MRIRELRLRLYNVICMCIAVNADANIHIFIQVTYTPIINITIHKYSSEATTKKGSFVLENISPCNRYLPS